MVTSVLGKINYDEKEDNQYVSSGELISSSKVTNILLLGVDARLMTRTSQAERIQ